MRVASLFLTHKLVLKTFLDLKWVLFFTSIDRIITLSFMRMFFDLELLKCTKKLKEMPILGVNEISSFPKQKCPPTQVKFYCNKIDNLLTTLIKVTCWVQYAICGIWVVGMNCVKVQIMKLILFWGASVVFQQVFVFFVFCFLFCFGGPLPSLVVFYSIFTTLGDKTRGIIIISQSDWITD